MTSPFAARSDGIRVLVRLSPKSARTRVLGLAERPDGRFDLKIAVKAPPEGGRANAELIEFLAGQWQLPRRSLTLAAGAADRRKTVLVAGDPALLQPRLETWLAEALQGASQR